MIASLKRMILPAQILALALLPAGAQVGPLPGGGPLPFASTLQPPVSLGTSTSTGVQSSNQVTTTTGILSGDLVVVVVQINSNAALPTVASVSDGTNSYTKATSIASATVDEEIWYVSGAAAVGSGATLRATWSGSNSGAGAAHAILAARVAGVVPTSALDKVATQQTTTASPSVTTAALAQASEIAFAVAFSSDSTYTQAAGFTAISNTSQSGNLNQFAYMQVNSTAAITFAPSWASSTSTNTLIATFK